MEQNILLKIKQLKDKYIAEGFIILGVFGSYARNEQTEASDIDILYRLEERFVDRYNGFEAFARLTQIKRELEQVLGKNVDIASVNTNNQVLKNYALQDMVNV